MADHGRTDELTGIIEGTPLTGSVVWVHDADIAGGTEPGRRVLLDSLPEQTRKLDLQILESLRARAEYEPRREPTQVRQEAAAAPPADQTLVGPLPAVPAPAYDFDPHPAGDATEVEMAGVAELAGPQARRGPPPPAHPAQWFDDLDLESGGSDTSPSRPLPWMDADRARPRTLPEPPMRAGEPPMRRRLLAQAEVAIVDMAYRYPGWGMVRVTNALRREGVDVTVKEVSEVLSRYGVWSTLGRAALQKDVARRSPRASVGRRLLLGFEVLAFATLTLAVAVAWLSI